MRKTVVAVMLALVVAAAWLPVSANSQEVPADPTGMVASDNVRLVTTLPNPGIIGARFRDGYMYATSLTGLTIYDISNPAAPVQVGQLPLPHFENEDVDLGGDILLISNDAAESTGILYVIDISDPTAPAILSQLDMGGNPVEGGPGHTASCIKKCSFAWVTDTGGIRVIDLRDPANPVDKGTFESPAYGDIATHDVQTDGNGLAWVVGFGGAAAYKIPAGYNGTGLGTLTAQTDKDGLSTYMEELGLGDGANANDFILHNSMRSKNSSVVYVTEEDYTRPGCRGAGAFQTWRVPTNASGFPNGKRVTLIDQWQTELVADTAAAGVMCSAHYFDVRGKIAAQGWYEQGIRFLDVSDPTNIRQIGFMYTPTSLNWAAYFAPTDPNGRIVYSLDASHGIDVLRIGRPAQGKLSMPRVKCTERCWRFRPPRVKAPVPAEWKTGSPLGIENGLFGFACRLGIAVAQEITGR